MWPPWLSSQRRDRTTVSSPSRNRSYGSSCCSFKDIQILLQTEPEPASPKSPSLFRSIRASTSFLRSFSARTVHSSISSPPDSDHSSVVVYYTSLRIVRRTFNDCRTVRSILRRFDVSIDERDVSVDDQFREELKEILGRCNVRLPSVFVGGEYIGGVDDVRRLYDSGELQEMIEQLPKSKPNECDLCGGLRFVVCDECDGSHKVFTGKNGFRSCSSCNTNGLIRCPACFFVLSHRTK